MIKHLVLWRLKDSANGKTKAENARLLKDRLEALNGRIPGLRRIEVGINVHDSHSGADDADVVLYSEFESQAALDAYGTHPEHVRVKNEVADLRIARHQVDYAAP